VASGASAFIFLSIAGGFVCGFFRLTCCLRSEQAIKAIDGHAFRPGPLRLEGSLGWCAAFSVSAGRGARGWIFFSQFTESGDTAHNTACLSICFWPPRRSRYRRTSALDAKSGNRRLGEKSARIGKPNQSRKFQERRDQGIEAGFAAAGERLFPAHCVGRNELPGRTGGDLADSLQVRAPDAAQRGRSFAAWCAADPGAHHFSNGLVPAHAVHPQEARNTPASGTVQLSTGLRAPFTRQKALKCSAVVELVEIRAPNCIIGSKNPTVESGASEQLLRGVSEAARVTFESRSGLVLRGIGQPGRDRPGSWNSNLQAASSDWMYRCAADPNTAVAAPSRHGTPPGSGWGGGETAAPGPWSNRLICRPRCVPACHHA